MMVQSMTGYGKGSVTRDGLKAVVEIRTLNSKQLDISVRMPQSLRSLEIDIRKAVAEKALRGKVDVTISIEDQNNTNRAKLNRDVILEYWLEILDLCNNSSLPFPSDVTGTIFKLPESITVASLDDEEEDDKFKEILFEALNEALQALHEFRKQEGEMLGKVLANNIHNIRKHYSEVHKYEDQRIADIRQRLMDALEKLTQVEIDKGRLEQEMIYYIEKLDITEEKKRLENHLSYFLETLEEEASGKKLGFIAQEIGREINTMGSKSNNAEMQQLVVLMKDELEQIKEQVLNVL